MMETPVKALTTLLSALGAFCLCEFRVSQQISTFYGPSVQTMETRLGARQRRRPPTVHRGRTHAPRLQRPVKCYEADGKVMCRTSHHDLPSPDHEVDQLAGDDHDFTDRFSLEQSGDPPVAAGCHLELRAIGVGRHDDTATDFAVHLHRNFDLGI